ncbi:hypothetical protein AAE478_005080 [Parahypoxylon ruwenzoriense]
MAPGLSDKRDDAAIPPYCDEALVDVTTTCKELGCVLGICDETSDKISRRVLSDNVSTSIPGIDVTIGFSERDVACFLGNTLGGRKFIALYSALATAFDPPECAAVLAVLIGHLLAQKGGHEMMTAERLSPLLSQIDERCQLSGFSNRTVSYEIKIAGELRARGHEAGSPSRLAKTPVVEAVARLVELLVLLQAGDSGNGDRRPKAIKIRAGRCAPWIAAFLHWWLGKASPIYLQEDEPPRWKAFNLHEDTGVGIELVFSTDNTRESVGIRALYALTEWEDFEFDLGQRERYAGLICVDTYFRLMLNAFRLNQGQAKEAAGEAIPYALREVRKGLKMCSGGCVSRDRWGAPCEIIAGIVDRQFQLRQQHESSGNDRLAVTSVPFEPFPERPDINKVLRLVEGCEGKHMQDLTRKMLGRAVYQHPQARAFLSKRYAAERAEWKAMSFATQFPVTEPSDTTIFLEQMAHIVATILAVSLFHDPERLLLTPDPFVWKGPALRRSTVISAIFKLFSKKKACCDVTEWHRVCRILAGEPQEDAEAQDTTISCYAGQAVWPDIVFARNLPKVEDSYLRLSWCRGALVYGGSGTQTQYHRVIGVDSRTQPDRLSRDRFKFPTRLGASNLCTGKTRLKLVAAPHGQVLECALRIRVRENGSWFVIGYADPSGILKSLAPAERLVRCAHQADAAFDLPQPREVDAGTDAGESSAPAPAREVYLCHPENALPWWWDWAARATDVEVAEKDLTRDELTPSGPLRESRGRPGLVAVVPVAGDEGLRLASLAKPVGAHVAVREAACAECCVRFCREFGFDILVL